MPIRVTELVPGGQGIGRIADEKSPDYNKVAFLWNALPGEEVLEYEVVKRKSRYVEGIAAKLGNYSAHRVEPKDECFLSTSPWQIMDFEYELKQKRLLVLESFRQAKIDLGNLEIEPTRTDGTEWNYRNKMEYALYWDNSDGLIKPAFRGRGTHLKIPIKTSSLERREIFDKAQEIIADLNARHEEARKYQSLLLRSSQNGEVSGGLFVNHAPHPVFPNLTDKILGKEYSYSPNGFFQINIPVYELALKEIAKDIKKDKVLDLYSGVGTIGLSIARDKDLTLVESNGSAYRELEKNCEGLSVKPILSRSEEALNYIETEQTVILDPPRSGCDRKLIEKLLEVAPKTIIYLSCNPSTQVRDVAMLTNRYEIERVAPFNFFPKTPHIENLVVLGRK
ncbi:class I SAM-dependent RNA methyltransferase [Candidatus Saccharibacteria bacterium]|nr:class I SAM-dependent RNA methyltransferase [Candidatus Saccharibacteria bacterium]